MTERTRTDDGRRANGRTQLEALNTRKREAALTAPAGPCARILAFMEDYCRRRYTPPTVREIQAGADISSTSMVSYYLAAMWRSGELVRVWIGTSRAFVPRSVLPADSELLRRR